MKRLMNSRLMRARHHEGRRPARPFLVLDVSAHARADRHHVGVAEPRLHAARVEQLGVGLGAGQDQGIEIGLDLQQGHRPLGGHHHQPLVVRDRPAHRHRSSRHLQTLRMAFHSASREGRRAGRRTPRGVDALGGRRMARPDAGDGGRVLGLLGQHLLEEARDAVGADLELLQELDAGGVGVALEGAAVAQRQQDVAARAPSVLRRSE